MKQILKFLPTLALLITVLTVTAVTQNPVTGLAAATVVGTAMQYFGNISFFEAGLAMCSPLVGLKRQCQKPSMGGAKRLYIALTEDILEEFLTYEIALTVGKFSGVIPMVTGKKWVEIEAWYDTTKFDTEMKIGGGFTQTLEFKTKGYNAEIVKLMTLLYETPVNAIVQGNDDDLYYLGQKYIPLMFESKGVMPEKGTSRKEVTFTAKQDGLQVPVFPLDATVTFDIVPLAA